MRCVPRILSAKNTELGRPLGPAELDDVTQETLLAIWKKLPTYDGRARLETWVFRFCLLELLKRLRGRRRSRDRTDKSGTQVSDLPTPTTTSVDHEAIHLGLEQLEPEEAQVVRLKHFDGLTLRQAAERLDMAESTIKSRYYRGIERLRIVLGRGSQPRQLRRPS